MSTIFTKIIDREIPAEILYESGSVIAIIDIMPIHYGHALIIPKKEYKTFLDVPESELGELMIVTQKIAKALVTAFNLEGFNFANNGEVAGQSVYHFHIHVTPRYKDDGISFHRNLKKYADNQMMKEFADKIRANIS